MAVISHHLKDLLQQKVPTCVLTGAGVSAESGVPTFRDKGGLWDKFKPEELASFSAFMNNPELVWEWYQHRTQIIREVTPNPGHEALATMEKHFTDFTIITQNVDNLHSRAGSQNVWELHGNIERTYCIDCHTPGQGAATTEQSSKQELPRCSSCGGLLRPDVVWFGEMLPEKALRVADQASRHCHLFLSVGTAGAVYPAAGFPLAARENGAYVVEINNKETELTPFMNECLQGAAGEVLPKLAQI